MIDNVLDRLVGLFKVLSSVALAGTMGITCVDVVGRFFGHPVLGSVEIGVLLAALALGFSLPYAHRENAHVGVEVLYMHLGARAQAVLRTVTGVAGVGLFGVIGWMCSAYATDMRANSEVSMTLQIPLHPIIFAISACFWLLALVQLADVWTSARKAVGR